MSVRTCIVLCGVMVAGSYFAIQSGAKPADGESAEIKSLIEKGEFSKAEKLLKAQIADPDAPVTSEAAIQLEVLGRMRYDYELEAKDVLAQIQQFVPNATQADVDRWREAGDLQSRVIDGEVRYFRRGVSNLFRFSADARKRRKSPVDPERFDTRALVEKIVKQMESSDSTELFPVKHHIHYELTIKPDHPRVKEGAVVRAWLPYPQEYRQQKDVKLISSEPPVTHVSSADAPQRTIYFEQKITDPKKPVRIVADYEFLTSAYCPKLLPEKVKPYDTNGEVYRKFTAERPPHILFTPEVKQLAQSIVGEETNPLKKGLLIFQWVSKNITWGVEEEYSTIPSLSAKGLKARRGDCGVQGTSFITLCRAVGVPARWQSGWQLKPNQLNMHDWAEMYVEPWGWLPVDASWGMMKSKDPAVRDYFCGHIDPYRLVVNLDYSRPLDPPKHSFRSEPIDFQRGEVEIDGHNLYYDEWDYKFHVKSTAAGDPAGSYQADGSF